MSRSPEPPIATQAVKTKTPGSASPWGRGASPDVSPPPPKTRTHAAITMGAGTASPFDRTAGAKRVTPTDKIRRRAGASLPAWHPSTQCFADGDRVAPYPNGRGHSINDTNGILTGGICACQSQPSYFLNFFLWRDLQSVDKSGREIDRKSVRLAGRSIHSHRRWARPGVSPVVTKPSVNKLNCGMCRSRRD